MTASTNRRNFLKRAAAGAAGLGVLGWAGRMPAAAKGDLPFRISLAEWSLHRSLFAGDIDPLNFGPIAKNTFGIDAIEYVNQFFMDKANDMAYLREMRTRAEWEGVDSLLIMIDGEGHLGNPDEQERTQVVENHKKWVEAAAFLACHSIRVNAYSVDDYEEALNYTADGLRRITEFADGFDIHVIMENHGGLSSNPEWVVDLVNEVDHPNFGTLPDFGNFPEEQNRYEAVRAMMPFAEAVSAKSYAFDANGDPKVIDYERMMQIVVDSGYHGYVGIEYEGEKLSEAEGIKATKAVLNRIKYEMAGRV